MNFPPETKFNFEVGEFYVLEPNIVVFEYLEDIAIELEHARLLNELVEKNIDFDYIAVHDLSDSFGSFSKEAMNYFEQTYANENKRKASCVVINSLGTRLIVKFYFRILTKKFPYSFHKTLEQAIIQAKAYKKELIP